MIANMRNRIATMPERIDPSLSNRCSLRAAVGYWGESFISCRTLDVVARRRGTHKAKRARELIRRRHPRRVRRHSCDLMVRSANKCNPHQSGSTVRTRRLTSQSSPVSASEISRLPNTHLRLRALQKSGRKSIARDARRNLKAVGTRSQNQR
jgi:hypothetical protein